MESILEQWRHFVDRQPAQGQVRPFILSSWERSRAAGVPARASTAEFHHVGEEETRRRLAASRELIELARPHLEWLSASIGTVAHAAYVTDADGIVLYAVGDPEQAKTLGLAPGFDWSERTMGTNGAGTALATGQPVAIIGPEHYTCPFHDYICTGAPIFSPDGQVIGAIDISTHVADGSPSRLSLVAHVAFTLETVLAQRRADTERQRTTRFLAMLAHELRNPLAPVVHGLEALRRRDDEPEQRQAIYGLMQAQLGRISRLVDEMMDVARVACGKLELRKRRIDLRSVVKAAVDSVRPGCAENAVRLVHVTPAAPVPVYGDPDRLTQVAANLLANACKFTPEGGEVDLRLECSGARWYCGCPTPGRGFRRESSPGSSRPLYNWRRIRAPRPGSVWACRWSPSWCACMAGGCAPRATAWGGAASLS